MRGFARRLTLAFLALKLIGREERFGGRPVAFRLAFRASFLEPQKIGELAYPIVAINHGRPRLERRSAPRYAAE